MDLRLNYQTPSCPRGFQPHLQQQQLQQQLQQQVAESTEPSQLATPATTATSFRSARAVQVRINDVVAREAAVAYGKIYEHVRHTPLEPSPWLSNLVGSASGRSCVALLKLESEQHTGSFKVRGALSKLLSLPREALARGKVFTASTGNHALAVLYACKSLSERYAPLSEKAVIDDTSAAASSNIQAPPAEGSGSGVGPVTAPGASPRSVQLPVQQQPSLHEGPEGAGNGGNSEATAAASLCTAANDVSSLERGDKYRNSVEGAGGAGGSSSRLLRPQLYIPTTASPYKIRKLRSLGAELHLYGTDCLQAELAARKAAAEADAVYVSPYNDPWVMAGQGTIGLELLAACRRGQLDVVLVPVGGGGLIGGIASVLKAADPGIQVVGCQPTVSDVMARSVAAGTIVSELAGPHDGGGDTLSDATAGGVEFGSATLQPCSDCVDEWVTVSEVEIAEALVELLEEQSKLVEGENRSGDISAWAIHLPQKWRCTSNTLHLIVPKWSPTRCGRVPCAGPTVREVRNFLMQELPPVRLRRLSGWLLASWVSAWWRSAAAVTSLWPRY
ncbi:hypothetical protein Vretimale_11572 [Volvox reticuliferus]|uniref:Tryptophan synthase beta chain-like PALP domain-containing protein n=1 Tax=Volvox reticuliferus TaxID=1737510 RepID=A0A8J4LRP3_9CHLO|nr:hypothetical protein Vretifemale_14835 [Volvox reticuliferus]GIM07452.1 hypothetical protein Vretimale_11572 [Volvox reticuliferus]